MALPVCPLSESTQSCKTLAAHNPILALLCLRNIPSYRTPHCGCKWDSAGRAGTAAGSLAPQARLTQHLSQKPHYSCEWQAMSL